MNSSLQEQCPSLVPLSSRVALEKEPTTGQDLAPAQEPVLALALALEPALEPEPARVLELELELEPVQEPALVAHSPKL